MKTLKSLTTCLILFALLLCPYKQVKAQYNTFDQDTEIHYITVIKENTAPTISTYATKKTKTASKTTYIQNSKGETLWYVTVTATFSYNGTSATCTASSVTALSCKSSWKVSNKKSSYSGNSATASATGKEYYNSKVMQTINKSVTLTCSKDGTLS
ncbi:MAG: hypothetical protein NC347_03735 [Clostridium sp.]|nr:hypothetical protein [Clostridium sp.]